MAHRLNVSDEEALLAQFVNSKKKPTGVGFQCWILGDDKRKNVSIGDELKIDWPNVDVKPARRMLKSLKTLGDQDWDTFVVKVLSVGGKVIFLF